MSLLGLESLGRRRTLETPYANPPWVIMKFGGTSVSTAENWAVIERLICERRTEGIRPVIVHSALSGVSNALIDLLGRAVTGKSTDEGFERIRRQHIALARALGVNAAVLEGEFHSLQRLLAGVRLVGEVSPRVHSRVLATGELAATMLGTAYLNRQRIHTRWLDARKLLLSAKLRNHTERSCYLCARCAYAPDPALQARLASLDGVLLTQGFIAGNTLGETVLLGRGGSDTSAAYFAAKLQAGRLEIWTDTPGFFSADPKAVPSARLIRRLDYREAQEIASAGGGILHPRSISPIRAAGIPLFLKCSSHPESEGTLVSRTSGDDLPRVKAISQRSGITLVSMEPTEMWQQVGFLADAFSCFREHGFSVDLISTSETNTVASIDVAQNLSDEGDIEALAEDLRRLCKVTIVRDCAAITLIGQRIRTILHELAAVLGVFEEHNVHLVTQAATDLNLTFVVDSEHADRLVQQLHALLLTRFAGRVFGPKWEDFMGCATEAREPGAPWWARKRRELLRLGSERAAVYVYDRDSIEKSISKLCSLRHVDALLYSMKANANPEVLRLVHDRGLAFACVSPGEIERALEVAPGLAPSDVLFTPSFAPRGEYEWALGLGTWVVLDSLFPLTHWPELFAGRDVLIRIDAGRGRGCHEHLRTPGRHSKFGVPMAELDALTAAVKRATARVVGLHAHTGSGALTPEAWRDTGERLLDVAERFPDVRYLGLGGGPVVPETSGQTHFDPAALEAPLGDLKRRCGERQIWLEPTRYIVAGAGVLLARVTQTKGKGDVRYVGVATGMNSLIRPALYGAYHEIVNLTRYDSPASERVTVVGPICETGDRLGIDRLMPPATENDVLLISGSGAYGHSMSSRYNLREPAAEVVI